MNRELLKKGLLSTSVTVKKVFLLLVFGTCLVSVTEGYQQEVATIQKVPLVSLDTEEISVYQMIKIVENQTSYHFSFDWNQIDTEASFIAGTGEQKVVSLLSRMASQTGLAYQIINSNIHLRRNPTSELEHRQPLQQETVRGQVADAESGETLPGVNVMVKGTTIGTSTDSEGMFELTVESLQDTLVFSFVGYQTREVPLSSRRKLDVTLVPEAIAGDELVVIGYGTQQQEKVTGAISQVSSDVLENRPITNLAEGLQGAIPNLNISFQDGEPNRGGGFNIRGFTSINGGSPLILIDGTPGDINMINPENVESVTVLKDASAAAIYGARGAFGVVLVETKDAGGTDDVQIRYSSNVGISQPTRRPQMLNDPLKAANIINEAYRGFSGSDAPNLPRIIGYLEERQEDPSLPEYGVDPSGNWIPGAETHWYDEFYNDYAPFFKNNLSISGREGGTNYMLSIGHLLETGMFQAATDDYNRYNLRLKLNNQVTDWLNISNNTSLSKGIYEQPNKLVSDGGYSVYRYLSYSQPWQAIKTPNENYTTRGMTSFGQLRDAGRTIERDQKLKNVLGLEGTFLDNRLSLNLDYTVYVRQGHDDMQYHRLQYEPTAGNITEWTNPDYYRSAFAERIHQVINAYTNFQQSFDDHYVKVMVGFNQEVFDADRFYVRRDQNITPSLGSLNLTTGEPTLGDVRYEWALRGFFGRLNYDYDGKYLFEASARYDGSSRFRPSDRWGLFPSVSVGWVVSEEEILESIFNESTFKLRASYGSLGNQDVSPYAYTSSMAVRDGGSLLDGEQALYTSAPSLTPADLTWETVNTLNLGFDLRTLNDRLQVGFDWYNRETKNMLTPGQTVPAVLGTSEPQKNAADLSTKGWEFSASWNDQLGSQDQFGYNVKFVLSDHKSTITRFDNPSNFLGDYYKGMEIGEIWGFNTLGFFETDDEYETHADQSRVQGIVYEFSDDGHPMAGDLKFEDLNGDGVIDHGENTLNNPGDRTIIGNTTPRYQFGFDLGASWKNFNVNLLLQGVGKRDFWPGSESAVFWGFYNRWNQQVMEHHVGRYWTAENTEAYFPRPRAYMAFNDSRSLGIKQTRYLQDASYLRIKNLSIGYTLPLAQRLGISKAQISLSGTNLYEFSKLSPVFDPEGLGEDPDAGRSNGNGFLYPLSRTFTVGLNITF